jgi:DNA-binding GntR family transcriptional regulator
MRARLSLEPALSREAAIHASASALAALELTVGRSKTAATWREYEALDNDFHRQIAEASGSLVLLALFDQLNTLRRMVAWETSPGWARGHRVSIPASANMRQSSQRSPRGMPMAPHAAMRTHLRSVEDRLFRAS